MGRPTFFSCGRVLYHKKGTPNIKVLAFGRVLKEFIVSGTANYPFAPDKVQTFMRWAYEILSGNGVAWKRKIISIKLERQNLR